MIDDREERRERKGSRTITQRERENKSVTFWKKPMYQDKNREFPSRH
jgi:hypothetical protein